MMSQNHNMKRIGRSIRLLPLVLAGLGLVLSACQPPPPKPPATTSEAVAPRLDRAPGAYKLGKPYQIGKAWYYPKADYGYDETGIASWYGPGFHGNATANGESFDQNALTAAHRTLPMPSMVRVTNLDNGRSIKVRINDRGPFKNGRIIDLSRRAADLLGFHRQGTAKVRVEIVEDESRALAAVALTEDAAATAPDAAPRTPVAVENLAQDADGAQDTDRTRPATRSATPAGSQTALAPPRAERAEVRPSLAVPVPDGIVTTVPVRPGQIYVQAGSFTQIANANKLRARLIKIGKAQIAQTMVDRRRFFRVRFGP
ncbi:MAG: septal ring lytic transglycosylase RlpA family protein, partial [Kiloniellales bacterium]